MIDNYQQGSRPSRGYREDGRRSLDWHQALRLIAPAQREAAEKGYRRSVILAARQGAAQQRREAIWRMEGERGIDPVTVAQAMQAVRESGLHHASEDSIAVLESAQRERQGFASVMARMPFDGRPTVSQRAARSGAVNGQEVRGSQRWQATPWRSRVMSDGSPLRSEAVRMRVPAWLIAGFGTADAIRIVGRERFAPMPVAKQRKQRKQRKQASSATAPQRGSRAAQASQAARDRTLAAGIGATAELADGTA